MTIIIKNSYYLGDSKDPAKKEDTKFKSDKRQVVYNGRFKEPMYSNYDLYEDGTGRGPGGGINAVPGKYKSVQEFLEAKRKRNKNKYVAPPTEYYADDGIDEQAKQKRKKQLDRMQRKASLQALIKTAQYVVPDMASYDTEVHSYPVEDIFQDSSMDPQGTQIGGMYDYLSPSLSVDNVSSSSPIGFIQDDTNGYDENYAKSKKHHHKKKLSHIHSLLDQMVGRAYSGYPIGYGNGFIGGGYHQPPPMAMPTPPPAPAMDAPSDDGGSGSDAGGDSGSAE